MKFPRVYLLVSVLWMGSSSFAVEPRLRFNRDVRPILSDKCFFCHGPDASKRKADLRLDDRISVIDSGAIVPGKPDESEILRRVLSDNTDERMPPAATKLERLSDQEIAILKRWIDEGAEFEDHWSFIPLDPRVIEPSGRIGAEVLKPTVLAGTIDRIIATGLHSRGLGFQPEADRSTLIRRLSFDLTGLPPTPSQVHEFVNDKSLAAYEKLVERLLDSEHYGERMAVDWLDTARYADSYGFQVDRERDVWPWRDWVIRSFNRNLPFDQFITWQLAGDLLPSATDDQILATAFNRLHQQETEGGSVEEEYRVEYVCDRVQTFATTFLGLTFECARCHDHKYDPVTQAEYYQLFAMFQNIDEAGLYSYFTLSPPTPTMQLTDSTAKGQLEKLRAKVEQLERELTADRTSHDISFRKWLEELGAGDNIGTVAGQLAAVPIAGQLARFPFDSVESGKLANLIRSDQPATFKGDNTLVPGANGQAIQFTGDDSVDLPLGNFGRHESFSISLKLRAPDHKERAVVFHRSRAWTDAASRGYELLIEDGRLKWSLIHFWPGNAISISAKAPLPLSEWLHVVVTYDGSSRANGLRLYVNGQPTAVEVIKDDLTKEITGGGGDHISLGERFRDRGFKGGAIDDFQVFARALADWEVLRLFSADAEPSRQQLFDFYLATVDANWKQQLEALKLARQEYFTAVDAVKEIMVMRESPTPKPSYVLFRGEYSQRKQLVAPGTPAALLEFPADQPRNRLGLARWLTDPQHPLTSRVTVNRVWQSIFGRGLVKTSEDFGNQGARPIYPEVLDALALELVHSGWNMKQLVKTIVMTRTYRQRSIADPTTMTDDPDNDWLARGASYRLPAEMIRDNALASAGMLDALLGGPPVNPYEMAEAFKPAKIAEGKDLLRRSLYTNWRRTGPPPAMLAFDAPRRAVCTAKRERTDSPLQALILLNGVQYVEAARVLGESLHRQFDGDIPKMVEQACMLCLSRRPDQREMNILTQLYQEQLAHFASRSTEAEELLKIGSVPRDVSIPTAQAAAATILAQALLNHDACVVKR